MSALSFSTRAGCITCGCGRSSAVWEGTYADPDVERFMNRYGYAVDWSSELDGRPISLVSCSDCNTLYHQHILDSASLERLYSDWIDEAQIDTLTDNLESGSGPDAQFEAGVRNVRHLLRLNRLLRSEVREDTPPWRILDFGCGAAEFLKQASLFGFETWGVDFSTTRASQALSQQISIISSLNEYRERANDQLHAITMFQVLEHLDDPRSTLLELAELLMDGGLLIIEVPDCTTVSEEGVSAPRSFEEFRSVHPLEHINAFTPESLTRLVESAGFNKINPGPAHVTDRPEAIVKSELTRFYEPKRTNQYFRKGSAGSVS